MTVTVKMHLGNTGTYTRIREVRVENGCLMLLRTGDGKVGIPLDKIWTWEET